MWCEQASDEGIKLKCTTWKRGQGRWQFTEKPSDWKKKKSIPRVNFNSLTFYFSKQFNIGKCQSTVKWNKSLLLFFPFSKHHIKMPFRFINQICIQYATVYLNSTSDIENGKCVKLITLSCCYSFLIILESCLQQYYQPAQSKIWTKCFKW